MSGEKKRKGKRKGVRKGSNKRGEENVGKERRERGWMRGEMRRQGGGERTYHFELL